MWHPLSLLLPSWPSFLSLFSNQFFFLVCLHWILTNAYTCVKLNRYEVIQYNHLSRNFPHAPFSYSLLHQSSKAISVLIFFPPLILRDINGITQKCILLCHTSLPNMLLRLIHPTGSFQNYCWVVFHCTDRPQFAIPFLCWWTPGLFPVWGIMNKAVVNNHVQVFSWVCVFFYLG